MFSLTPAHKAALDTLGPTYDNNPKKRHEKEKVYRAIMKRQANMIFLFSGIASMFAGVILLLNDVYIDGTTPLGCCAVYVGISLLVAVSTWSWAVIGIDASYGIQANRYLRKHHPRPAIYSKYHPSDRPQYEIVRTPNDNGAIVLSYRIWEYDKRWSIRYDDMGLRTFNSDQLDEAVAYETDLREQAQRVVEEIKATELSSTTKKPDQLLVSWANNRAHTAGAVYQLPSSDNVVKHIDR